MEYVATWIHSGLSKFVPFIVLLGLLIFVHELGHFLVAKFFKVRVEVFSLGFGKKLFKITRGATDYCISVIPFGGYVKMFGDEPGGEIPAERRAESFNHKPVMQRIAIVLAGPLMNLFFAFFLFISIAFLGESFVLPVIGDVSQGTAAYEAGFRSGDKVLATNGTPVRHWEDLKKVVEDSANRKIVFQLQREGTNAPEEVSVTPAEVANKNVLSTKGFVGEITGLSFLSKASIVGVSDPKSIAAQGGLRSGDIIVSINGKNSSSWRTMLQELEGGVGSKEYRLEIQRGDDEKAPRLNATLRLPEKTKAKTGLEILSALGLESSEFYVDKVMEDSAAGAAGLKHGDKIISADGKVIADWETLVKTVEAFGQKQAPVKISVLREGSVQNFEIVPRKIKQLNSSGKEEEMFALGIMRMLAYAPPSTGTFFASGLGDALATGYRQTVHWTQTTVISFLRIVQNKVSAKSIGGPIMIGQLASETFKIGISPFLKIMAIISLNLFVLNLLPVPVLDGGHLVFYSIELIRGAPLSLRKMEILQQVGLVLLLSLMAFALFNDFSRILNFTW